MTPYVAPGDRPRSDGSAGEGAADDPVVPAERRLDHAFCAQAARTPDRVAIAWRDEQLSYRELDERSNRLARHLRTLGVGRHSRVAIALPRRPELIVALLAVLKAGAAYVPIDPTYPDERRAFMLQDCEAEVLVTVGRAPTFGGAICNPQIDRDVIAAQSGAAMPTDGDHSDPAMLIYTSGSTGTPKGVLLGHSAGRLIAWLAGALGEEALSRVAATTSICFDPSVIEIFAPLSVGGAIILKDSLLEPFAAQDQPTLLQGVPSVVDELARGGAIPPSVRAINVGGEALSAAAARRIYRHSSVERVFNHYGPTEATIVATIALVDREARNDPSIGTPVAGARIHLLDEAGAAVAAGEVGEIHIAGDCLAIGYWRRADLTADRFKPEPGRSDGRMYRTGDLARWDGEGRLIFVGRRERQVKIRGCRVELGEVERALCRLPRVDAAAATVIGDSSRHDRLIAFVETRAAFDEEAIRDALAQWLPRPMLPSRIVRVDHLPRSGAGKVDHGVLASLLPAGSGGGDALDEGGDRSPEATIAHEMARLLARAAIDVNDDFFHLGGDSLAAFQLAVALEQRFDQPISPATIAQARTPRALANLIEATMIGRSDHLCQLADGDAGVPLFCLPDLSGELFSFHAFAERASGRPVLGLSPGPIADAVIASPVLETLGQVFADAIVAAQPSGPQVIVGYSFGGVAAFDVARRLEQAGHQPVLVLIDAFLSRDLTAPAVLLPWLARHGLAHVREQGGRAVIDTIRHSRWMPWGRRHRRPPDWVSSQRRALAEAMIASVSAYRPGPFGGRTVMIGAGVRTAYERLLDHDGRQGWRRWLIGDVSTASVDTTHLGLMREPHVGETVQLIESLALRRA